jgi:hypothetical protein
VPFLFTKGAENETKVNEMKTTARANSKEKENNTMEFEIIWEMLQENIFAILSGVGVIISIILGKPKTAEKLNAQKEKKLKKLKSKFNKKVDDLKKLQTEIDKENEK